MENTSRRRLPHCGVRAHFLIEMSASWTPAQGDDGLVTEGGLVIFAALTQYSGPHAHDQIAQAYRLGNLPNVRLAPENGRSFFLKVPMR